MRALVVGLGNCLRGDDGLGPKLVRRLERAPPHGVELVSYEGDPTGLIDLWADVQLVVLIDATSSRGKPGTIRRFDAHRHALPKDPFATSSHLVGLTTVVELARTLDRLAPCFIVFGVEGKSFELGRGLSPEVERALILLEARVRETLRRYLEGADA
jgi:hydrogenase maturation protease